MATLELDPMFVKALRLLHSKSKDSAIQLRAMVDEAIAARRALKSSGGVEGETRASSKTTSKEDDVKKREVEKRTFEKLKQDLSELGGPVEPKKAKLDALSTHAKEERKEREKEKEREKAKREKERREEEREKERQEQKQRELELEKERLKEKLKETSSDEDTVEEEEEEEEEDGGMEMDADDFAIGLGISCEVCRQFDVSSGNQLVECQECHALYHQECHKPPVTEQDVNDPRFVWYCNKCSRTMKKIVPQKPSKSKPVQSQAQAREPVAIKVSKQEPPPVTFAFRRTEVKLTSMSTKESQNVSVSSKPLLGLASLAANLSKPNISKPEATKPVQPAWKTEISKLNSKDNGDKGLVRSDSNKSVKEFKIEAAKVPSPSGSAASGAKPNAGNGGKQSAISASSMATANKRLQLMKKAAAKQQEKRIHIK